MGIPEFAHSMYGFFMVIPYFYLVFLFCKRSLALIVINAVSGITLMVLYRICEILSYSLNFYLILGLQCLIVLFDYRILTTVINISDIKIFVNSMFKAEWLGF